MASKELTVGTNRGVSTSKGRTTAGDVRRNRLRYFWLPAAVLLSLAAGGLTGILAAYQLNYSQAADEVASLATYRPPVVTKVYADDGKTVIGEFALEKRIPIKYEEIPPNLKNAILAVEDTRFFDHIGIDPVRIIGATIKNIRTGSREGGSTLTQQLAKNLFLSREQTLSRKVNEWLVALQIERFYTKQQIMEMYVNHIFLGAGAYGFEAAAQTYFGKSVKDLSVDEAALLAGIPRSTAQYAPTSNMQGATERRNLVLELMAKNGYITESQAAEGRAKPIVLVDTVGYQVRQRSNPCDYAVEEVRRYLEEKYTTRVAQGGLSVYTTINIEAQKEASESVKNWLRNYDKQTGWHSNYKTLNEDASAPTQSQLDTYKYPDWYGNDYEVDQYLKGLVMKVDPAKNEALVRFGDFWATVKWGDMGRSGRQPKDELKPGFLCEFKILTVDQSGRKLEVELQQVPEVEGAWMMQNAHTGEIITMVGGYDFYTDKFNYATQGERQTGSAFKPFIYSAAVEWGLTPDSIVSGAPIKRGNWTPHNYDGSLGNGDVPLKIALAKSLNIPAVHLLDMVGIQTGSQMVRRFGIKKPMAPYLPSALGATEVPLDEMVSAYSAFPNKGIRVEPHLIRKVLDRDGNILEQWEKTTYKVINEYVAGTMVSMMRGVITNGTATSVQAVGHQVAGKTGTVNDHTDVWFVGYTATYVGGFWMGYPGLKRNLGNGMTGGHGAAPVFTAIMKEFMKDKPKEVFDAAPKMPEDMKELKRQRDRESTEEKARVAKVAGSDKGSTDKEPTPESPEPKQVNDTLPPPPRTDNNDTPAVPTRPRTTEEPAPKRADPPPAKQPDAPKKKGKKGGDEG
ncbi:MAG: PBP1A family penicillin-binding protein [Pyrinomonadaceae bacterium]